MLRFLCNLFTKNRYFRKASLVLCTGERKSRYRARYNLNMSDYKEQALSVLKKSGFRITKPRKLVLDILDKTTDGLSAYEIRDEIVILGEKVDIVSIYRIIDCLDKNQLIHKILSSNKIMKCQLKHEKNCALHSSHHCHHLIICEKCNSVEEIHCKGIDSILEEVQVESNFKIKSHNLEFYGLCKECI